jgi:ribosome maturation factor RimP
MSEAPFRGFFVDGSTGFSACLVFFMMGVSPFFRFWVQPKQKAELNRRERQLEALFAPTVEALGLELWGVEYFARGKGSLLRIYIEGPDGVTVEDCERISKQVSGLLDVEDPIDSQYTLEVSSPGFDRPLFKAEHYQRSIGATVDVRLNFPFEGRRRFVGPLVSVENDEIVVRIDDTEYLLPIENVQRARIVPVYE